MSEEARKLDHDKIPFELLPSAALGDIANIFGFGSKKYSPRNWELGMQWSRMYGALQRHLNAWWSGENTDPETGKSHLHHAGCCLLMLIEYEKHYPEKDDRTNLKK